MISTFSVKGEDKLETVWINRSKLLYAE